MVSVLVAFGLMGVLALVIPSMMTTGMKSAKTISNKIDYDILRSRVHQVIQDADLCSDAFVYEDSSGTEHVPKFGDGYTGNETLNKIVRDTGSSSISIVKEGEDIGGIKIEEISFDKIDKEVDTPSAGKTTYLVNLIIEAKNINGLGGHYSNEDNPFQLNMITDSSNFKVQGCDHGNDASGTLTMIEYGVNWRSSGSPSDWNLEKRFGSNDAYKIIEIDSMKSQYAPFHTWTGSGQYVPVCDHSNGWFIHACQSVHNDGDFSNAGVFREVQSAASGKTYYYCASSTWKKIMTCKKN